MIAGALVVNADDLGVSKGATLGIMKAHREGIVTSASLAATTPFYEHAVRSCVQTCPDLGIGLHLTLTSGKPVSPAERVPLLIDKRGFFRWRFLPLLAAVSGPGGSNLLEQIEIELEAQLERLRADGIPPDHIDGERHVHLIPAIFDMVAAAARRYSVPFVRVGTDIGPRALKPSHLPAVLARGGFAKYSLVSSLSMRNRRRLPSDLRSPDSVVSYLYSGQIDRVLEDVLSQGPRPGITEIMVHPGIPEESTGVDVGNAEIEGYLVSEDRRKEMNACIEARAWTRGWALTNYTRIARMRA